MLLEMRYDNLGVALVFKTAILLGQFIRLYGCFWYSSLGSFRRTAKYFVTASSRRTLLRSDQPVMHGCFADFTPVLG